MLNPDSYKKSTLTIIYLLSSMLTTVINKYIISVLKFKMLFLYLAIQSFFIVFILYILTGLNYVYIRRLTIFRLAVWAPCAILLTLMIYTGAKSLDYLPISIFTLFKNFSIIINAVGEKILYRRSIDKYTLISFSLMLSSSVIGEYSDFYINFYGIAWTILNVISTSGYLLLFKYNIDTEMGSNNECIFYCNFMSIPILLVLALFFDNIEIKSKNANILVIMIILSGFCAFFISYSTTLVLKNLSSTTLGFLGAMNKLIVSFSGIIFIGERNVGFLKIISLVIGSLGGLIYSKRIKSE